MSTSKKESIVCIVVNFVGFNLFGLIVIFVVYWKGRTCVSYAREESIDSEIRFVIDVLQRFDPELYFFRFLKSVVFGSVS